MNDDHFKSIFCYGKWIKNKNLQWKAVPMYKYQNQKNI